MSSMPARKINPKETEKKAYEKLSVAEEFLKKDKEKLTVWDWMMIVPLCVFVLFALLEEYAGSTIFESSDTPILSALAIIFGFGFLMSTVATVKKGRVRVFRRRTRSWKMRETEWVEKSKNPRKFLFVVISRLGVAFAVCIGAVYAFLTNVF